MTGIPENTEQEQMQNAAAHQEELIANMIHDLKDGLSHGILVANLTGLLAVRLGLEERDVYSLKLAGFLHDVGKLKLSQYLYGRNTEALSIEQVKYMRMHAKISHDYLRQFDFEDDVLETVLRHHECYDGSGYPDNLSGNDIPYGARILKVADEFAALISERPYRRAFDIDTAVDIMIEQIKNMDMRVFLEFQRMIHEPETLKLIEESKIQLDESDIRAILGI